MGVFASFNPETREVTGFYDDAIHERSKIPDGAVEVTAEARRAALAIGGRIVIDPATGEMSAAPAVAPTSEALHARLAALRFESETGGIEVGGVPVPTDRASAAMMASALATVKKWPIPFKSAAGFVDLDEATTRSIAEAVATHVQDCFAHERDIAARIEAGELATIEEVDLAWANRAN